MTTTADVGRTDQLVDALADGGVGDGFQFLQLRGIGEDDSAQGRALDLAIRAQDIRAKRGDDGIEDRSAAQNHLMRHGIGINGRRAQFRQHAHHQALARGDVAG